MSELSLIEIVPAAPSKEAALALIEAASGVAEQVGGQLIESEVTADQGRVFVVVETPSVEDFAGALEAAPIEGASEVSGPDRVRLVGAELEDIKAARPSAGYLVEWDIPSHIDMDTYLARKKEKSPKYAEVPEVAFLRTYVREDMVKCLCLYNAPDEDAVVTARKVVETPIDRLHALAD
ncbi:DUF4242 domain-containing protein [Actinomycetota bacterium]